MTLTDFIIIYLSCGAPFGVYNFYQKRAALSFTKQLLNSILVTLFWIPYAIRLLHSFITNKLITIHFEKKENLDSIIDEFEKSFGKILLINKVDITIFEFREVLERYAGLTKASKTELLDTEHELFQVANHENIKLATKILNRRNRLRLSAHHTHARKDFLQIMKIIESGVIEKEKVRNSAIEFVKIINDVEAIADLHNIFQNPSQLHNGFPVNEMENEVWNPIETKLPMPQKTLNLQTLSATATTLKHD